MTSPVVITQNSIPPQLSVAFNSLSGQFKSLVGTIDADAQAFVTELITDLKAQAPALGAAFGDAVVEAGECVFDSLSHLL